MGSTRTDEELMILYQQSDPTVFSELFARYSASVEGIMRRQIWSDEDVRELVQQTFLQLHRARLDYQPSRPFRPWLITIALNLRRQFIRKAGRKKEMAVDQAFLDEQATSARDVEQLIEAQRLRFALAKLKDRERTIVEMFWFEGLSFEEISQVMSMGVSAAKVAAHRAYKKLHQLIIAAEKR